MASDAGQPNTQFQFAKTMQEERAKFQEQLKNADERAEAKVTKNVMRGQGQLFVKLKTIVEKELMEGSEHDAIKAKRAMKADMEKTLLAEVDKIRALYDEKFLEESRSMLAKVVDNQNAWEKNRIGEESDKLLEIQQKILIVEQGEMEARKTISKVIASEREAAAKRVSELHGDVVSSIDRVLVENRDAVIATLESWFQTRHSYIESEVGGGFTNQQELKIYNILDRMRSFDEKARAALSQNMIKEIEILEKSFENDRSASDEATASVENAYRSQLEALSNTLDLQQSAYGDALQALEDSLSAKYDVMLNSLREKVALEQESQVRRAVGSLKRSLELELHNSEYSEDEARRAEEAAAARFYKMLDEIRSQWEEEQNQKAQDTEARLKFQYEEMLVGIRKQCEMAMDLMNLQDQVWLEDTREGFRSQTEIMEAFKAKCQHLYSERMEELRVHEERRLQILEKNILDEAEMKSKLQHEQELQLRIIDANNAKWKDDRWAEAETMMRTKAAELERKYVLQLAEAKEEVAKLREKNFDDEKARLFAEAEVQKMRAEKASKSNEANLNEKSSKQALSRGREMLQLLRQHWEENECSPDDRAASLEKLLGMVSNYNPDLIKGAEIELEMARVASVILRLRQHFKELSSNLKGFDDSIETLEKQTKFVPARTVAPINTTIESTKVKRAGVINALRGAAQKLANLLQTFKRCYRQPFKGGPAPEGSMSIHEAIFVEIQPWLTTAKTTAQTGADLELSLQNEIAAAIEAMTLRWRGRGDPYTEEDWIRMTPRVKASPSKSPRQNTASPAQPVDSPGSSQSRVKNVSAVLGSWGIGNSGSGSRGGRTGVGDVDQSLEEKTP